jgi:hypothetical protein
MSFNVVSSLKDKMGVSVIYEKKTELLMAADATYKKSRT